MKTKTKTPKVATMDAPNPEPVPQVAEVTPANKYLRTVTLDGTPYTLDFDFKNLCAAEAEFLKQGHYVNLLFALSVTTLNLSRLRNLFAAAVRTHHPELGYEGAVALVTTDHLMDIANAAFSVLQPVNA